MLGLSLQSLRTAKVQTHRSGTERSDEGRCGFVCGCQGCPGIESLHITTAEALAVMFAVDKAGESSV